MPFDFLRCLVKGHRPVSDRISRRDGRWISTCRHCEMKIRRRKSGSWHFDWGRIIGSN